MDLPVPHASRRESRVSAPRATEIGIRMTLGAQSGHVLSLMGKSGLRIALTSTVAGVWRQRTRRASSISSHCRVAL
jgi:hypothetical protein